MANQRIPRRALGRLAGAAGLWWCGSALGCRESPGSAARATPGRPLTVWLGGDVHLGAGGTDRLRPLAALLAGGIGVVNLEGPVAEAPVAEAPVVQAPAAQAAASGTPTATVAVRLVNAPQTLQALYGAGVRVVGIANNHAVDQGPDGVAATIRALDGAGLMSAGGAAGVAMLLHGDVRVALTAHDLSAGVAASLDGELARARASADALIATFHVTGPPSYLPRPELELAVQKALSAGARVIAAHGSHALARVERRGQTIIAWGLGNLLFECDCTRERDGAILRVTLDGARTDAMIIPVDAGLAGAEARPAADPALIVELLTALGSSPLTRNGATASF